jgi:hypothetical protein
MWCVWLWVRSAECNFFPLAPAGRDGRAMDAAPHPVSRAPCWLLGKIHRVVDCMCQRCRQQLEAVCVRGAAALDAAAAASDFPCLGSCRSRASSVAQKGRGAPALSKVRHQVRPLGVGQQHCRSLQRRSLERVVRGICASEKPAALTGLAGECTHETMFMKMLHTRNHVYEDVARERSFIYVQRREPQVQVETSSAQMKCEAKNKCE